MGQGDIRPKLKNCFKVKGEIQHCAGNARAKASQMNN
jgi:hypothetical protein